MRKTLRSVIQRLYRTPVGENLVFAHYTRCCGRTQGSSLRARQQIVRRTELPKRLTPNRTRPNHESGLALITTMWIMAVLSVLATEYLYTVHLEQRMGQNLVERTQYEYIAKAGIANLIRLLATDELPTDSALDEWMQPVEGELEDPTNPAKTFAFTLTVTSENDRVDINVADQAWVQRVLEQAGADAETAPTLAQAILTARQEAPFRTTGDLARVEGMTAQLLYGGATDPSDPDAQQTTPLVNLITVYSVEKNVTLNGQARTNITSADANALRQGLTDQNGQQLLSQAEADALIAYRQATQFQSAAHLVDAPAITQAVLDGARDLLSTQDEQGRTNVNTADAQQLQGVNGFDEGTAADVVRHRQSNGNYNSVDDIRNARVFTLDEVKQLVDKATIRSENTLQGAININTASEETLARLPGMDATKAQAIVNARPQANQATTATPGQQQAQAFDSIGDLLDIQGFDENTFKQVANYVTYRTQVFRVQASGLDPNQKTVAQVVAILDRSGDQVATRYWQVQ